MCSTQTHAIANDGRVGCIQHEQHVAVRSFYECWGSFVPAADVCIAWNARNVGLVANVSTTGNGGNATTYVYVAWHALLVEPELYTPVLAVITINHIKFLNKFHSI